MKFSSIVLFSFFFAWFGWRERGGLFRFDNEGKGCDGRSTYECGPWYIDDTPSRSAS